MNIEVVENIKITYPELYNISKKLHKFDKEVSNLFIKTYGDNTYDNIMTTHEYNKEIENVSKGISNETAVYKLAQRRQKIFQKYTDITYEITKQIGFSKTIEYMDILSNYFKIILGI